MRIPAFILLVAGLMTVAAGTLSQQIDNEFVVLGGSYRLEHPSAMAVSPGGEKIAISDPNANRIYVIDLQGRVLWVAGEQVRLEQPDAICFESESRILFASRGQGLIMAIGEETPHLVDSVCDVSAPPGILEQASQIKRRTNGDFLVLDRSAGEIAAFDAQWEYVERVVAGGSGKGKLTAPSSFDITASGNLVVGDRKNLPVQVLAPDGRFLFYAGWNQPSEQVGWEAATVAIDSRGFIWAADETNAQFRLFDHSGTLVSTLPFRDQAVGPVAVTGTIDNRVAVLEQTGALLFYTLE